MVHLVYCEDESKELLKILDGSKTMIIRGRQEEKYPIVEFLKIKYFILWKKAQRRL